MLPVTAPRVLASADPWILERALLDGIAQAKADDPLAPVLVIVPTRRLAAHVSRRMAERFGAVLGVEVLHHRRAALAAREAAGAAGPEEISPVLLRTLLRRTVRGLPDNPWSDYLERRPGAAGALLETLTDLREAGITPGDLRAEAEASLAAVYAAWVRSLEDLARRGHGDAAAALAAALPHVARWAGRFAAAFHHGAYDLTGLHRDVVQAVAAAVPLTLLLPGEPGTPGFRSAQRLADAFGPPGRLSGSAGLLGDRLALLGVEEARPAPLGAGTVPIVRVPGARAEATWAVRRALAAVREGMPPDETAVLVRSLGPYAHALSEIREEGPPLESPLAAPLRRHPAVHDLLLLLRAVVEDFPRAAVAELARSPRLRRPVGSEAADRWSRRAGLLGGLDGWTGTLPAWAGRARTWTDAAGETRTEDPSVPARREAVARALGRMLEDLRRRLDRPRRWRAHASAIAELPAALFTAPDLPGLPELAPVLEQLAAVGEILGDDRPVPLREALAWLEEAVDESVVPPSPGGIPVLDLMQARGLTFRRASLAGMHEGSFPRRVPEDPFLPDTVRRALRARTGRPLPVKAEARDEETALLGLALGAAGEALEISWQRSDETGRERAPSPALREVARLVLGRPDLEALEEAAETLSVHPRDLLEQLASRTGLLAPEEEPAWRALTGGEPSAFRRSLSPEEATRLGPGLDHLDAVESFAPGEAAYDGRAERAAVGPLSVHAVEALGRCPLQFFFRHVLRVREPDEEPTLAAAAREDLGSAVHGLLEGIYRTLAAEGLFGAERGGAARRRAAALLADRWEAAVAELAGPGAERLPVLWGVVSTAWRGSLETFLDRDLARLAGEDLRPEGFEVEGALELRGDPPRVVRGRLDRLFRSPDGTLVVGDYKTSGTLARKADAGSFLRGEALQVPLYFRMAGAARVELLGVGPGYEAPEDEARRVAFTGFDPPTLAAGFDETLDVLASLAARGVYPMHPDRHCAWCAYRRACRRTHAPSEDREQVRPDAADARDVRRKSLSAPMLGDVRRETGDGVEA